MITLTIDYVNKLTKNAFQRVAQCELFFEVLNFHVPGNLYQIIFYTVIVNTKNSAGTWPLVTFNFIFNEFYKLGESNSKIYKHF